MNKKEYLGDGVYAEFDGLNLILTTSDGIKITNAIILDPNAVMALLKFVR